MERIESHQPKSLREVAGLETELSPDEVAELLSVAVLETKETLDGISVEIAGLDSQNFSLDAFYELQGVLDEYQALLNALNVKDEGLQNQIDTIRAILERKNPICEVAENNSGYVLVHSSNLRSLRNLIYTRNEAAEVCATANSLRNKDDIFQSHTKSIEAGIIYDPREATRWFSKDVGSHTSNGKRVLEKKFEGFIANSLDDALEKQSGPRIEAWVDAIKARPVAILIIDDSKIEDCVRLARELRLPIVYNSHFFEKEFAAKET